MPSSSVVLGKLWGALVGLSAPSKNICCRQKVASQPNVKFLRTAAGDADDGASDDSDDDDARLLERADAIAEYVVAGEPGLIDAARDKRAAGDKEVGTYYVVEFTSGAYELEKEYNSPDYGVLHIVAS